MLNSDKHSVSQLRVAEFINTKENPPIWLNNPAT